MKGVTSDSVRAAIVEYINQQSNGAAVFTTKDLPDERDLLLDGLIDSLGLLGLIETLRERFGEDLDFEKLDVEQLTVVGPLCNFIAEQAS